MRRLPSNSSCRTRSGFTLVEVLISMALTLVLMSMLYTAMDLHYRFSTAGQIEVERCQIARALLSEMSADIRSTVFVPEEIEETDEEDDSDDSSDDDDESVTVEPIVEYVSPDLAFASSSLGLFGDSESIVIHVRRPRRPEVDENESILGGVNDGDLMAVSYFLLGGNNSMNASFGDQIPDESPTSSSLDQQTGVARMVGSPLALGLLENVSDAASMSREARMIAAEIEALQFEYHDGYEWVSEWDSDAEGRLPNAVGIKITFRDEEFEEGTINQQTASELTKEFNIVVPLTAANPFEALAF